MVIAGIVSGKEGKEPRPALRTQVRTLLLLHTHPGAVLVTGWPPSIRPVPAALFPQCLYSRTLY